MSCVSGAGLLFGFSTALASAKKKDSNAFDKVSIYLIYCPKDIDCSLSYLIEQKGITMARVVATETGGSLAMRALLWGTVYACTGFGLICLTVWKAMDVKDVRRSNLMISFSIDYKILISIVTRISTKSG